MWLAATWTSRSCDFLLWLERTWSQYAAFRFRPGDPPLGVRSRRLGPPVHGAAKPLMRDGVVTRLASQGTAAGTRHRGYHVPVSIQAGVLTSV